MRLCTCACQDHSHCHHRALSRGAPVTLLVSQSSKFTKSMMFKSMDHVAAGKLRLQSCMRSCSAPGDWLGFQPRFPVWAVSGGVGVVGGACSPHRDRAWPTGSTGRMWLHRWALPLLRVWMLTLGLQWMMWAPSYARPCCWLEPLSSLSQLSLCSQSQSSPQFYPLKPELPCT